MTLGTGMHRLHNSSYALRLRFYTLFYYNFSNFLLLFLLLNLYINLYIFIYSMILASDDTIRTIFIVISPSKCYVKRNVTLTKNGKSKIFYFSRNNVLRISRFK